MVRLKWPQFSLHKTRLAVLQTEIHPNGTQFYTLETIKKSNKLTYETMQTDYPCDRGYICKIIWKSQKSCKSLWSSRKWQNRLNICHFQLCACQLNRSKDFVMLFPFSEHKPDVNSMRLCVNCSLGVARDCTEPTQ